MTDREFTLLMAGITALPTITFTGFVAYWTWRRDQERLVIQKVPFYYDSVIGTEVLAQGVPGGILVRNLSLFPVRVAGLAFVAKGKFVEIRRGEHGDAWPTELPSHAEMLVNASSQEWQSLKDLGHGEKIENAVFVVEAITETRHRFTSNTLNVRLMRALRGIGRRFRRGATRKVT
jgi:hypothetical protein